MRGGGHPRPWWIAAAGAFAIGALALATWAATGSGPAALSLQALLCALGGWVGSRWDAGVRASAQAAESAVAVRAARDLEQRRARFEASAARVSALPDQLSAALDGAASSVGNQEAAIEHTASLLAGVNASIHGIHNEVESLARANEDTAASIEQMSTAIEQVAESAVALSRTVESSNASIEQMGVSIRRVAESGDEVQQIAVDTATATTQMDRAIQEVGEHVRGASDLTLRVSQRAEEGSLAVGETIRGIQAIRDQTLAAKSALEALAGRIGEIGEIATVIGGISEETSLLSLNAAIIAVQAGEHGKAFAVVADQVKTLSRRTSHSAKQIEQMIHAVQTESANAVRAMGSGIGAVQEGVTRSKLAGEALQVIRASARDASGQVSEIHRATEEQARNSKHVAAAAQRVSDFVLQISQAMTEQSAAGESLSRNVGTYLQMARQVAQATDEQRSSGRYITKNSHAITGMIRSIEANTTAHEKASQALSERFDALRDQARRTADAIPRIASVVDQLRRELAAASDADASSAEHSAA